MELRKIRAKDGADVKRRGECFELWFSLGYDLRGVAGIFLQGDTPRRDAHAADVDIQRGIGRRAWLERGRVEFVRRR